MLEAPRPLPREEFDDDNERCDEVDDIMLPLCNSRQIEIVKIMNFPRIV